LCIYFSSNASEEEMRVFCQRLYPRI